MKNIDINEFKKAANEGRVEDFIDKKLSPEAAGRLKKVLSDKDATQKLMSTPQAKELMKKLMKNDG